LQKSTSVVVLTGWQRIFTTSVMKPQCPNSSPWFNCSGFRSFFFSILVTASLLWLFFCSRSVPSSPTCQRMKIGSGP
jgi:hypothetical protein